MKAIITILLNIVSIVSFAQLTGKWKTIDDETGKAKSIVEIFEQNGKLYGKVTELFREAGEDQNPVCDKCSDERKNQPIRGMIVLKDMQQVDGFYKNGTICDPKKGKVYNCEMWLDAKDKNKLQLRGYWGFLYRTQTWHRVQ